MRNQLWKKLIWLLKRAIVFYLAVVLLSMTVIDYKKIRLQDHINKLNAIKPASFRFLIEFARQPERFNAQGLLPYLYFYQTMTDYFPGLAEAHGMLGFGLYYLGKYPKAAADFKKAIELQPDFFWFYYDLGVIYFKQGNYEQAIASLQSALKTDPQKALDFIKNSSVVYKSILLEDKSWALQTKERLGDGYRRAYKLLLLSYDHLNNFRGAVDLNDYNKVKEFIGQGINESAPLNEKEIYPQIF